MKIRAEDSTMTDESTPLQQVEVHGGQVYITVAGEWDEEAPGRIRLGPKDEVFTMFADKMAQEDFGEG